MRIGYARVSTQDQSADLQVDALGEAGCEEILVEKVSGTRADRPKLEECLRMLRAQDKLVVWRLDRLGRSLQHLVATVSHLEARGIGFESLNEKIDTGSAGGQADLPSVRRARGIRVQPEFGTNQGRTSGGTGPRAQRWTQAEDEQVRHPQGSSYAKGSPDHEDGDRSALRRDPGYAERGAEAGGILAQSGGNAEGGMT